MKKLLFSCVVLCLIAYSFFFPEITVNATKKGLQIWFSQILPALLPFTVISTLLVKTNFLKSLKGNANLFVYLIILFCGFIFGFPIGAKLSADFYKQNLLTKKQATILSIGTNNFSPMYVCGFVLPHLFRTNKYHMITYLLIYLVPLIITVVYLLLNAYYCTNSFNETSNNDKTNFKFNMSILDDAIISGFESLIKICGYIVLFSIVTSIFTDVCLNVITSKSFILTLLLGNLEITNGIQFLSSSTMTNTLKYITTIQFLSFGGLSGIVQSSSIFSDAGLSTRKYIIGKASLSLLITLLAVIYVFVIRLP